MKAATRARLRLAPPLSRAEVGVLAATSYDAPSAVPTAQMEACLRLVAHGLIERNPNGETYRRTDLGNDVLLSWLAAGWALNAKEAK